MFYLVIKNHPFRNGNKRMAIALTLTFLYLNGQMLYITNADLYNIALNVASSNQSMQKDIVNTLYEIFRVSAGSSETYTD